jgi:N-acyl-D-amino-acid deacylase
MGFSSRAATATELASMQQLVEQAMKEGALGVGAALIYPPGSYADTEELIAFAAVAAKFGGGFSVHARSEGDRFLQALKEVVEVAVHSGAWAHVHHLKPIGERNWHKRDDGIALLEEARTRGLEVSANMYVYNAAGTSLTACIPPSAQEGGRKAFLARLRDQTVRAGIVNAMQIPPVGWENLCHAAGGPDNVIFTSFKTEASSPLIGKTLAEVADLYGLTPEEAVLHLVAENDGSVSALYVLMADENVASNVEWPHMMFGSDEGTFNPGGAFSKSYVHPRAYGNVARLLGVYVRERGRISFPEAIRRLTTLPAETFRLEDRGCIAPGCFADLVVLQPDEINDYASYRNPHQLSTGVRDVMVNGRIVLRDGAHTGEQPGQVVRGPGWAAGDRE